MHAPPIDLQAVARRPRALASVDRVLARLAEQVGEHRGAARARPRGRRSPSTIGEIPGISVITTTTGPVPLRYTVWVTPSAVNGYCSNVARSPSGARRRRRSSARWCRRSCGSSPDRTGSLADQAPVRRWARRRGQPPRLALLGEGARALLLVGVAPHADELPGAGAARVGEPELERAPQRPLGRAPSRRGSSGRSSRRAPAPRRAAARAGRRSG